MPADDKYSDCVERYLGVPDLPPEKVTRSMITDAAWWAERRGLHRAEARNVKREQPGRNLTHHDGRGARESFTQACRWMFTWLADEEKATANPAGKVKLLPRQEAPARSLTAEEFGEVYGVGISTGRDPVLDGLVLRHLLIQAVRRGGLLGLQCGALDVECQLGYYDKKKTWRYRHLAHDGGSTTDHYLKERFDELAKLKAALFEPNVDVDQA